MRTGMHPTRSGYILRGDSNASVDLTPLSSLSGRLGQGRFAPEIQRSPCTTQEDSGFTSFCFCRALTKRSEWKQPQTRGPARALPFPPPGRREGGSATGETQSSNDWLLGIIIEGGLPQVHIRVNIRPGLPCGPVHDFRGRS